MVSWLLPFVIYVGSARLSPYRFALLLLLVPAVAWVVQGRAGRWRWPDTLLTLFTAWSVVCLAVAHGSAAPQSAAIMVLETMVPYFVARCCIRSADDFLAIARLLCLIAIVLLPFAAFEAFTGRNIYLELASRVWPSIGIADKEPRWGLRRSQLFFEHPILMGVCMGSIVAIAHLVVGRGQSWMRRALQGGAVALTGALSLSSGPLSGIMVQVLLLAWNAVLSPIKARWTILISTGTALAIGIQLLSKRPLPNILVTYAFEQESAYFRIIIWEYGVRAVAARPLFGVGLGQWERPDWMPQSIDMFWLYNAIAYGLPGAVLMLAFFLVATLSIGRLRQLDARHYDYRAAYLITMAAFFLTGWMVHFWNGTYIFFLFMVGAGMWLLDAPREKIDVLLQRQRQPSPVREQRVPAQTLLNGQAKPAQRTPRSRNDR